MRPGLLIPYEVMVAKRRTAEAHAPRCLACHQRLTDAEIERYTSWCDADAPVLALRFEE